MPTFHFTALPQFLSFTITAEDEAKAMVTAAQLGDGVYDLGALKALGVTLDEIGPGDAAEMQLTSQPGGSGGSARE